MFKSFEKMIKYGQIDGKKNPFSLIICTIKYNVKDNK